MSDNYLMTNLKKRLHEIDNETVLKLSRLMSKNWEKVIKNIPNLPLTPLEVENVFGKLEFQGKNPAESMFLILGRRGVTLESLIKSFEIIKFEEGLKILKKPNVQLISFPQFPPEIHRQIGDRLILQCQTTGFPYPKHTFYRGGAPVSYSNPYIVESLTANDDGFYLCEIVQPETNACLRFQTRVYVEGGTILNKVNPDLKITIHPLEFTEFIGSEEVTITAKTNINDESKLKFQWYKKGKEQDEAIIDNHTAQTNKLVLKNIRIEDEGKYTCQVTNGSQIVVSNNPCKLIVRSESHYELKIALIIGNGDYKRISCEQCEKTIKTFDNLDVCDSLKILHDKLVKNEFLVLPFVDLDAESFLRVIKYFCGLYREKKNVMIFVYVGGHGYHVGKYDYLLPADIQIDIHKEHKERWYRNRKLRFCSLPTILENICPNEDAKYTFMCFWDLCRSRAMNFPTDCYSEKCPNNLDYNIVFSCNVGANAYEVKNKGSIVLNILLTYLEERISFEDILHRIQSTIKDIKKKSNACAKIDSIKVHTTVSKNCYLSTKAKDNYLYEQNIKDLYMKETNPVETSCFENIVPKNFSFRYKFKPDTFLNSLIFEIQQLSNILPVNIEVLNERLRSEQNEPLSIKVVFTSELQTYSTIVRFDSKYFKLYDLLHNPLIETYVERKLRVPRPEDSDFEASLTSVDEFDHEHDDFDESELIGSDDQYEQYENLHESHDEKYLINNQSSTSYTT